MKIQKSDFIEIEFTGKSLKDNQIFDSNVKEDLKNLNPELSKKVKPFIFSLGNNMFLDSLDEFLEGKEIGVIYEVELEPEKAFGKRDAKQVQIVPLKLFRENKLNPVPGFSFNFDGRRGKVLSSNGGRIMVDFNHPLAGHRLHYKIKINRKVDDKNEQIRAFNDFLFKQNFDFSISGNKLILEVPKQMKQFLELFIEKYKEVLGLELEVKEKEEKLSPQQNDKSQH